MAAAPAPVERWPEPARLEVVTAGARPSSFSPASRAAFALLALLYAAVRFWKLTAYGLFSDEVFSAETAHRAWPQLERAVVTDVVHPPLFYYLLKIWIALGDTLFVMKSLPVLFSILALVPFVLLGRQLKLRAPTINLALFLMAANEYLVSYAQELRMYSLLLLLVTTSMWLFAKIMNAGHRAVGLQVAWLATSLLLVYTHYYGWLVVTAELLFVIVKRRDRLASFGLSAILLVAGFLPWMFAVTEAAYDKGGLGPNLKWNPRPTLTDFVQHYLTLNGPVYTSWRAYATVFSIVIFFTPILLWAGRLRVKVKGESGGHRIVEADGDVFLWLALLAFLPSVIAFAASYLLAQSVWGNRFLIVVAPAYLLLVSIAAARIRPPRLRRAAVVLMIACAGLSGALQLTHRDKIDWRPLVERLTERETNAGEPVHVYTRQGVVGTTIQYYLDRAGEERLRVRYVDDYAQIDEAHFWIAFIRYRHESGPLPSAMFTTRGDRLGEAIEAEAPGHQVIFIPVWRASPR
jgi:4-amino-4-deoxy-L-arabinose transferase-like glycosyltransferase